VACFPSLGKTLEKALPSRAKPLHLPPMKGVTNSTGAKTKGDPNWCDPTQHSRDERNFVEMIVFCAVVWLAWRLYKHVRRRTEIPRLRRRQPPGANETGTSS
jgi:hypothetical protein